MLIGLTFTFFSCEKENITNKSINSKATSNLLEEGSSDTEFEKPRITFKHGIGCNSPLGICISAPISLTNLTNSSSQDDADTGTVKMRLEGKKMHIIFDRAAALPDGTVPISRDLLIEGWKNGKSVVIKAGNYKADFSKYKFGEIWASAYSFK